MRIRFCKSMNRADPCAGKKRQGRIAEPGLRMVCSLLLLVWAIPDFSPASDNLARGLSDYGAAAAHFAGQKKLHRARPIPCSRKARSSRAIHRGANLRLGKLTDAQRDLDKAVQLAPRPRIINWESCTNR